MKLLIIADDLTGALDTAIQIAKRNVKTLVTAHVDVNIESCEALSVNLDMRHDTPDTAFRKVTELLRSFPDVPYIYLKTDSVLRGNLSAAFAALLAEAGKAVMFVPAYPKAGRVTIAGAQLVGGQRLENSPFARDPLNPMTTSCITEILNLSCPIRSVSIANVPSELEEQRNCVFIFDCEAQERLAEIASFLHTRNALRLTSGCAGFAEVLCDYIPFARKDAKFIPIDSPVLFLSGSASGITFDQLAIGRENGIPIVKIPTEIKLSSNPPTDAELEPVFALLNEHLSRRRSAILATAQSPGDLIEIPPERHASIQRIFAQAAARFVKSGIKNLAIFGGDTALAALNELGCKSLRPIAEVQNGIPLCKASQVNIVTKSGGLGDVNAVTAIEKYMRGK